MVAKTLVYHILVIELVFMMLSPLVEIGLHGTLSTWWGHGKNERGTYRDRVADPFSLLLLGDVALGVVVGGGLGGKQWWFWRLRGWVLLGRDLFNGDRNLPRRSPDLSSLGTATNFDTCNEVHRPSGNVGVELSVTAFALTHRGHLG